LKVVIDASFLLNTIFDEVDAKESRSIFENIEASDIYVPSHFNQEISQAIYLGLETQRISTVESDLFLQYLSESDFTVTSAPSARRLKSFCVKNKISSYDAAYLILAQDLNSILITKDQQMQKVAKAIGISLEVK
jgi:predicted nucleic acid-binding protein